MSLRNMIGRSFATEDAQDLIRAAVIDLFEILESEVESNLEEVSVRSWRAGGWAGGRAPVSMSILPLWSGTARHANLHKCAARATRPCPPPPTEVISIGRETFFLAPLAK